MSPNRLPAIPGTILFFVAAFLAMGLGQALVMGLVAMGPGGADPATWAETHPLLGAGASWLLVIPMIRLLGGWMSSSTGEDFGVVPRGRPAFALGLAIGVGMLAAPAGIARLLGGYTVATSATPVGSGALAAMALSLPLLVVLAFGEELLFRGFLMRYWRGIGPKGALLGTSIAFAAVHSANPHASVLGAVGVVLAGLALGVARMSSGGLWLPTGIHLGWNATAALGVGLPISGFELPSLLRWTVEGETARGLLGGGFGPEEGLAYHGAWVLGLLAALVVGPLVAYEGPPMVLGEGGAASDSVESSSPR